MERPKIQFISENRTTAGESPPPSRKVYKVVLSDIVQGHIRYFKSWQRYAFYPNPAIVLDEARLTEIVDFIARLNNKKPLVLVRDK